ncbi:DedA family protein [Candidatus Fukatsuia symbiotica]|uniref:DedA family protein n=1 Tax=Candidatus Fukatsuia symbiotica TaxID=1878942 RepID=A0A2U8I6X9_9GAMM|nr:DedA family protein [Candidatus Fukatsuia symbiotica]AWK14931.1 DedA family protein [Candidatus Fukatsuia symbiotica]MEA9445287.1 DedA family protein [Candidatus Fukatsuia symbiotica]
MEAYLQHLLTQSLAFTLLIIVFVTFLESLALIGLLLPGTVMMTSIGVLIGNGHIGFYPAWVASCIGCLLGDWASYLLGRVFKQPLHRWSFLKKRQSLLDKTEHALYQHSMATILLGRFIGPSRPLVPMIAGMLALPPLKFASPNIIACLTWPPVYLFPGILAGVAFEIANNTHSLIFKWLLFSVVLLIWLAAWLGWRWRRHGKHRVDRLSAWLPRTRLRWLTIVVASAAVASFVCLYQQPLMPIYRHLLWQVLTS